MICQYPGRNRQLWAAICVYIGQLAVGYSLGWPVSVLPKLEGRPGILPTPAPEFGPSDSQNSTPRIERTWIVSVLYLGGLAGPYLTGFLANKKGRKLCMMLGGLITAVSYLNLASAYNLTEVIVGRFICGFGIEVIAVMSLLYLGEITSTHVKGVYLSCSGLFISVGTLIAFIVGPLVTYSVTAFVGGFLASLFTVLVILLPESPVFYAIKGQSDSAKFILHNLGRSSDINRVLSVNKEMNGVAWIELFASKGNRKAIITTVILSISQYSSGILSVTFLADTIFEKAGSSVSSELGIILMGCMQLLGELFKTIFIERCGRRNILLISTFMCCLSMFVLGIYFYMKSINHWTEQHLKWLPLSTLVVFNAGLDSGMGIIPNAFVAEMFEPNVQSTGCAVAITTSWVMGFVVTIAFSSIITAAGGCIGFWVFSGVCALTYFYVVFFIPDTRRKNCEGDSQIFNA